MAQSRHRRAAAALAVGIFLPLAGCGTADAPSSAGDIGRDTIVQPTQDQDPTTDPTGDGRTETGTPGSGTPSSGTPRSGTPGSGTPSASERPAAVPRAAAVDLARRDLADRLGVKEGDITVTRNEEVTWRDGSLGCAEKGRAYTMMLVAGQLIVLEAGGKTYEYHAGRASAPFLCENPQPPLPAGGG